MVTPQTRTLVAASAQQPAITIEVHRSASYGAHLTDGRGRALYLFTDDRQATATLPSKVAPAGFAARGSPSRKSGCSRAMSDISAAARSAPLHCPRR